MTIRKKPEPKSTPNLRTPRVIELGPDEETPTGKIHVAPELADAGVPPSYAIQGRTCTTCGTIHPAAACPTCGTRIGGDI